MVGKILRTQSEAHVELAEYSCSVASLSYRGACACYGGSAKRKRRAAGRLCVGERTEWHPGTIEADDAEHAVRSAGNDRATEQLPGRSGGEFQALPQPGCAV